jgi:hypothetical protein
LEQATKNYAQHQIVREEPGHWLLSDGEYDYVEIVVLWEQGITVSGFLAYAQFFGVDDIYELAACQDEVTLSAWANRDDGHSDGPNRAEEWDQGIAYDDLKRLCEEDEYRYGDSDSELPPYDKEALEDAKDSANKYSYMAYATKALRAKHFGELIEYNDCEVPGDVIDGLVLYAQAAVARLVTLRPRGVSHEA